MTIANSAWLLRDHMIVYTYFNFGCKEYLTETERKFFLPWRVPAFVIFLSLQLLSYFRFSIIWGEKYAAYLQNIAMSALYLSMLRECGIDKGQTIAIAVCKCIGTRTPTICGTP